MCLLSKLSAVVAMSLLIAGCSEVTRSGSAPLTLIVQGKDTEEGELVVLEGAELCDTNTGNCALSDARGWVTIILPIGEESSCTVVKEGYASYLIAYVMQASGHQGGRFEMATHRLMVARHEGAGAPYPMIGTGTIMVGLSEPFAGATLDLVDATGTIFYWDEAGNWNPDLTETTSVGWGGFVQTPPGRFQVELGGTAENCVPAWAWPGDENTFWFPVRENHVSVVTVTCPLPPP